MALLSTSEDSRGLFTRAVALTLTLLTLTSNARAPTSTHALSLKNQDDEVQLSEGFRKDYGSDRRFGTRSARDRDVVDTAGLKRGCLAVHADPNSDQEAFNVTMVIDAVNVRMPCAILRKSF
ncbi:hypothetical protein F4811DRAFT_553843 [Daldinia bambusicola]|nr:hypothetical protein F4811DRAFT_553843 [Daldinia bambusicola]